MYEGDALQEHAKPHGW